ncbi:hypothetical protein BGZ54_007177 [Gamsiella multidivaricata]|nr:hypothetical protein BGZ54_007177 [Gamsiella multidivaricata]
MFSKEQLRWAKVKVSGEKHVTFINFVTEFKLTNRLLATDTYAALIGSEEIRERRREKLQESFNVFQAHHADTFWSERRLEVSSEITANGAALDLQAAAAAQSRKGAANYVWDASHRLPGISSTDHDALQEALRIPVIRLSDHLVLFCRSLERDILSLGYIKSRDTASRDHDIMLGLFQQASLKLPRKFLSFKHLKNEDTHAHSALDALLTDRKNGDAHKPDATVLKDGFEMGYLEIKPPKEERHQRLYLEDIWALLGLAKDNIDFHFRCHRIITTIPCVLVFGK